MLASATLAGGKWNGTSNNYEWDGPAGGDPLIDASTFSSGVTSIYNDFDSWLTEIKANEDRGNANWWPGAYQK